MHRKRVDVLTVYGFHPDEMFALDIGRKLAELDLEGVEAIMYTPESIRRSYENPSRLSTWEEIRISTIGRKELRKHIKKVYGKVGFALELHNDPAEVIAHGAVTFPRWNTHLNVSFASFKLFGLDFWKFFIFSHVEDFYKGSRFAI